MANTRQFDRIISAAQTKLAAVQRRETWALTVAEQRKFFASSAVAMAKATRQKSSPRADRAREQVWTAAESRLRAEITAAETARQQLLTQAAADKVARRSTGWW